VSADDLTHAYARFEAAQERHDRQELVTARLALCLALLETGWSAPDSVKEQMRRDEKTLRRLRDSDQDDLTIVLDLPAQRWRELRFLVGSASD
jgi:hypothetical protein